MSLLSEYLKKRFEQTQVFIFGLGREGLSSYSFIRAALPDAGITLLDDQELASLPQPVHDILSQDHQVKFLASAQCSPDQCVEPAVVIKTAGIPSSHPVVTRAQQHGAQITSNTQLFFDCLKQLPSPPLTIGVTGTKGKSTTASLIFHVLKQSGRTVQLAGNIGTPALDILKTLSNETVEQQTYIVLELSSHQLRELSDSPNIAVIQNITPEHLDYYPDFETYRNAKGAITKYQSEKDAVIYCPQFPDVQTLVSTSPAQRYTYAINPSEEDKSTLAAFASSEGVFSKGELIMPVTDIPLVGNHNLLNVLPSVIIGNLAGIESSEVANAIRSFKSLPHRLEFSGEKNGVRFFNDSQATTPEAAIAALRSFPNTQIHLIAGGSDKGVDLTEFAQEILTQQIKTLILFPPMGSVIEKLVQAAAKQRTAAPPAISHVQSMKEAVGIAIKTAQPGDIVLLSPACASFGIFKNYQDRGDQFKREVSA